MCPELQSDPRGMCRSEWQTTMLDSPHVGAHQLEGGRPAAGYSVDFLLTDCNVVYRDGLSRPVVWAFFLFYLLVEPDPPDSVDCIGSRYFCVVVAKPPRHQARYSLICHPWKLSDPGAGQPVRRQFSRCGDAPRGGGGLRLHSP